MKIVPEIWCRIWTIWRRLAWLQYCKWIRYFFVSCYSDIVLIMTAFITIYLIMYHFCKKVFLCWPSLSKGNIALIFMYLFVLYLWNFVCADCETLSCIEKGSFIRYKDILLYVLFAVLLNSTQNFFSRSVYPKINNIFVSLR